MRIANCIEIYSIAINNVFMKESGHIVHISLGRINTWNGKEILLIHLIDPEGAKL